MKNTAEKVTYLKTSLELSQCVEWRIHRNDVSTTRNLI